MPRTKESGSVFERLDELDNSFGAWSQIDQLWLVGKARELAAERDALRVENERLRKAFSLAEPSLETRADFYRRAKDRPE